MEKERNDRISEIDKATDQLQSAVDKLAAALVIYLTAWFAGRFFLNNGIIDDSVDNYEAINNLGEAKSEFFSQSVVPFLSGISLAFFNINNLNKKYFETVADEPIDQVATDITNAINSAFGFNVTDKNIEIEPGGWLANIGDLKSVYDKVRESAMKAVSSKQSMTDFLKVLKKEIEGDDTISGLVKSHFKTIVWDVYAEFDRQYGWKYAVALGYRAAIYEGGLIDHSREFCIVRNGKVFTFDEIKLFGTSEDPYGGYTNKAEGKFDGKPSFDYDPFFDQGGHNCRHSYSYIPDRLAIRLRPELKDLWNA